MVEAGTQSPAFHAGVQLRCSAHDPELRADPRTPYDFTVPEGGRTRTSIEGG
jgi:hypothetical protein